MTHPELTLCELTDPGIAGIESYSPFCLKVHRALKHLGLPYTRRFGVEPGSHRAHNPLAQVPVLLAGERAVFDSSAILRYLDDVSGGRLVPREAKAASEAWLFEELADTAVNGFLVAARWADEENWKLVRDAYFAGAPAPVRWIVPGRIRAHVLRTLEARDVWRAGAEACWSRFRTLLDDLEARAPSSGFWVSEAPSVADFALFGQLHSLRTPLTARQAGWLAEHHALTAWLDRVDEATRGGALDSPQPVKRATSPTRSAMSKGFLMPPSAFMRADFSVR
jgi:glutathione S-transferase